MKDVDNRYAELIFVPSYATKPGTECDKYFEFRKRAQELHDKRTIILAIAAFAAGCVLFFQKSASNRTALAFLVFGLCLLFYFANWSSVLYLRALRRAYFSDYPKAIRYIKRLANRKEIFFGMPLAYTILRAKKLLLENEAAAAKELITPALSDYPNSFLCHYVKALCCLELGEDAGPLLQKMTEVSFTPEIDLAVAELISNTYHGE